MDQPTALPSMDCFSKWSDSEKAQWMKNQGNQNDSNWIKGAIKHPGAFSAQAKAHGESTAVRGQF